MWATAPAKSSSASVSAHEVRPARAPQVEGRLGGDRPPGAYGSKDCSLRTTPLTVMRAVLGLVTRKVCAGMDSSGLW